MFGPNNFPYAFNSVAGGDAVAAWAAGNPVIGKANTGHPGTSKLLAERAFEAARAAGLPPGMVQLIYRTPPDVGFQLVSHSSVGATGFTGSKSAGLQLKEAAERAGKPIYLEMSSVNPIFVLPAALEERGLGDRQGAVRFVRDGRRPVLHPPRHHRGRRRRARARLRRRGAGPLRERRRRARCSAPRASRRSPAASPS